MEFSQKRSNINTFKKDSNTSR